MRDSAAAGLRRGIGRGRSALLDIPLHPVLIGTAFVLNLWAENLLNQVQLVDVLPLWMVMVIAVVATGALVTAAVRNVRLAGTLTTVVVVWFLSFGYVLDAVRDIVGADLVLPAWIALGVTMLVLMVALRRWMAGINRYLNVVSVLVLLINLGSVGPYQIAAITQGAYAPDGLDSMAGAPAGPLVERRDIYYIVLDRYPSQQTLAGTAFEYDNGPFLRALEERGFYVAEYSHANYTFTAQSLASSLNMTYLDVEAMADKAPATDAWKPVYDMLAGSLAAPKFLEEQGYTYVQLPSWFEPTAAGAEVDVRYRHTSFSEFARAMYRSTVLSTVLEELDLAGPDTAHVDHAMYQFDRLQNLEETGSPKFVFAHVLLPHPPYVFGPDGPLPISQVTDGIDAPREAFLGQLEYTNRRVLEVVDALLGGPEESDPIVILQADEGPYNRQVVSDWRSASPDEYQMKFGILNAYHTPARSPAVLYPSITPVNSFRLLFNSYFGTNFPRLDDRIYAMGETIYDNVDITEDLIREPPTEVPNPNTVAYDVDAPNEWTAGASQEYVVVVRNTGDVTWRKSGPDAVRLTVRFADLEDRETVMEQDFAIEKDVPPGETSAIEVRPSAPDADGEYLLSHQLVHGVTGFKSGPSTRATVTSTPETWDRLLAAGYRPASPSEWIPGSSATYEVRVTNQGQHTWSASGDRPVRLGVQFGNESDVPHDGWATDQRFALPYDVAPGRSVVMEVEVTAPEQPGRFVLRHRLVKENTVWFGQAARQLVVVAPGLDALWVAAGVGGALLCSALALWWLSRPNGRNGRSARWRRFVGRRGRT